MHNKLLDKYYINNTYQLSQGLESVWLSLCVLFSGGPSILTGLPTG